MEVFHSFGSSFCLHIALINLCSFLISAVPPALINSAGILSSPGDLKFLNFFIDISTSISLGLGIHSSAV